MLLLCSKNRPRLLFTFYLKNFWEKFLFSAPEYDDDKSSSVLARYDMTISDLDGFVCFRSVVLRNPRYVDELIAYDTVEDQYKVLCVKMFDRKMQQQQEHFVCTLSSSQKQEWRMIENRT
uniref:F-box associated beta-propeller type 3 domain-containing protein n=1 Tax=Brassica oleracea var. oleracea TaxID=109376 RepID=A0A0D2ZST3_BRAOL